MLACKFFFENNVLLFYIDEHQNYIKNIDSNFEHLKHLLDVDLTRNICISKKYESENNLFNLTQMIEDIKTNCS